MEFRIGFRIKLHLVLDDDKHSELDFKLLFASIPNLVAFNLVFIILLLWDLGRKNKLPAEYNGSIALNSKWYGNCKEHGHWRLNFLHQFCPHMVTGFRFFWGDLSLYMVCCTLQHGGPSLPKVVYANFDSQLNNKDTGFIHHPKSQVSTNLDFTRGFKWLQINQ